MFSFSKRGLLLWHYICCTLLYTFGNYGTNALVLKTMINRIIKPGEILFEGSEDLWSHGVEKII